MKGVILAGGLGTRLAPLTQITNKHLLPVWDKPMIYYPIEYIVKSGIDEVLLITGGSHAGHFLSLLKNGKQFGLKKLEYAYQEGEGGIADALKLAKAFAGSEPICVVLGDNLYQHAVPHFVEDFQSSSAKAAVLTQRVDNTLAATRFGVLFSATQGKRIFPMAIREKPEECEILDWRDDHPQQCCHVVTGTYFYRPDVFDICEKLTPSARNELEITDVNKAFLHLKQLKVYEALGWWVDAGTFSSLSRASRLVQGEEVNHAS